MKIIVRASNENVSQRASITIDGPIGNSWWDSTGISSQQFTSALDSIPVGTPIDLYVNSEGGSVQDGLKMYHAIKARSDSITCYIHGYAVSIASLFPLAAHKVISPVGSVWMIHLPSSGQGGNVTQLAKDIEMLTAVGDEMAACYSTATGKSKRAMMDVMTAETWMTSKEAVEFGLAQDAPDADDDVALMALDTSKFKNIPQALLSVVTNGRQPNRLKPAQAIAGAQQQTNTTMDKAKLIAKLVKLGVAATADWSEDQLLAALDNVPAPIPATKKQEDTDIAALRAQLTAEKRARITALVTTKGANKIPNTGITWWVEQAMADETATIARIDEMQATVVGGAPIGGHSIVLGAETPLEKIKKDFPDKGTPTQRASASRARFAAFKEDWQGILADAFARDARRDGRSGDAIAANTFNAALTTQFLIDGATTQLQNKWAALKCFSRDFSVDPYKPLATGQYKFVTGGGVTQTNATNFESGDSVVAAVGVTVNQYTQAFHVTNSELNSGLRMENLIDINVATLADKVTTVVTAPITAANFPGLGTTPTAAIVRGSAAFSFSDMSIAWGLLKKSPIHNAILDGEYLGRIINVPTQFQKSGVEPGAAWAEFGWDNIALGTNWTGSDANVRGFFCNPQAIAVIAGLPLTPPVIPGATLQENTFMLPGIDVALAVYFWFSLATRTAWCSYDIMLGASLLDPTAGLLLKSQ